MDYQQKYIKYKNKYLELKQNNNILIGGIIKEKNNKKKNKKNKEIRELKKYYNEQLAKIDYIKIQLQPYLKYIDENNNNEYVIIKNINEKLEKIFKKKLEENYKKIITNGMLYSIIESKEIIKYQYDQKLNIVNIYIKPLDLTHIKNYTMSVPFDPKDVINAYAWDGILVDINLYKNV